MILIIPCGESWVAKKPETVIAVKGRQAGAALDLNGARLVTGLGPCFVLLPRRAILKPGDVLAAIASEVQVQLSDYGVPS